ncbi:MAG: hypothetical protein ACXWC9_00185 [Pseudobdellovibrionaceae bacterium]
MKHSLNPFHSIGNSRGSAIIVIVCLIISGILAAALIEILNTSNKISSQAHLTEARMMIFKRTQSMLRSPAIVNYTLAQYSTPAKNAQLKKCIQSGNQEDPSCSNISLEFYYPKDTTSGVKFAGTSHAPSYANQSGDTCEEDSPGCYFKVDMDCYFLCPGGQTSCAMVKVMGCDLKVTPASTMVLRALSLVSKTQTFAAAYSIRLSDDMNSFSAVSTYVPIPCYLQSIVPADCHAPAP